MITQNHHNLKFHAQKYSTRANKLRCISAQYRIYDLSNPIVKTKLQNFIVHRQGTWVPKLQPDWPSSHPVVANCKQSVRNTQPSGSSLTYLIFLNEAIFKIGCQYYKHHTSIRKVELTQFSVFIKSPRPQIHLDQSNNVFPDSRHVLHASKIYGEASHKRLLRRSTQKYTKLTFSRLRIPYNPLADPKTEQTTDHIQEYIMPSTLDFFSTRMTASAYRSCFSAVP